VSGVRWGDVAPEVARELPGLGIAWREACSPGARRSPPDVHVHLGALARRFAGRDALRVRVDPVGAAYRAFLRQVGLDPDVDRPPVEQLLIDRLIDGGLRSRGAVGDALVIGALETGVPLWALDAERVTGGLGVRVARAGERLGDGPLAPDLPSGRLVVADARGPVAVPLGAVAASHGPTRRTSRLLVFAVSVAGVSRMHVEEALWACLEALGDEA